MIHAAQSHISLVEIDCNGGWYFCSGVWHDIVSVRISNVALGSRNLVVELLLLLLLNDFPVLDILGLTSAYDGSLFDEKTGIIKIFSIEINDRRCLLRYIFLVRRRTDVIILIRQCFKPWATLISIFCSSNFVRGRIRSILHIEAYKRLTNPIHVSLMSLCTQSCCPFSLLLDKLTSFSFVFSHKLTCIWRHEYSSSTL